MTRRRSYPADIPFHLVHRGVDRQRVFFSDIDRARYLAELLVCSRRHNVDVHAYVLMDNHVHLLATAREDGGTSRMMRDLGRRYVPTLNARRKRSGTLWSGRHYSAAVERDRQLLACYRYIELNPVRARMVRHAGAFRWSSHRANALGTHDDLSSPHATYLSLGPNLAACRDAYACLFDAVAMAQDPIEREASELRAALGPRHTAAAT